jgi:hypothetical protein
MSVIKPPHFWNLCHLPIGLRIVKLVKHKLKVMHSKVSFFVFEKVLCFYTMKACYHRPPLIFGPKTSGYKHQIRAGPPRSGVSLPLSGNQFKVFFLCI